MTHQGDNVLIGSFGRRGVGHFELLHNGFEHRRFVLRAGNEDHGFGERLHHVLQSFGVLLQVGSFDQHGHAHRRQSGLLAAPQYDEAFFRQPAAQISRHDGGVDQTAFERLAENRHVADDDHLNIVPSLIHAEMFQPYGGGFPHAAAETLNAEAFAAQIFGAIGCPGERPDRDSRGCSGWR